MQVFVANGILYNHESPQPQRRKLCDAQDCPARGSANLEGTRGGAFTWEPREPKRLGPGPGLCHCDVADVTARDKPADYVVATGVTHSVRDFVEAAFSVVNLPWQKYVKHNPAFDRPTDPARLVGSPEKIRVELGWEPQGSFGDLVREMVEAELAIIDAEKNAQV